MQSIVSTFFSSTQTSEGSILENNTDRPVQALCVGEAGSGKTTLAKRLAWLWASRHVSSYFWSRIKAVIFVTSEDEGDNLHATLQNSIPGKKAYKESIMDLMKDEPEAVLVILEAFEDFQYSCVIEEAKKMIKDRATNVFMTMRKGHPKATQKFMSMFNQLYEANGFTPEEGANYARKQLVELGSQHGVTEFLEAMQGKPQFETNPLNLTLACQLYGEGELQSSDMETLTEVNLYSMREDRMVERECEKQQISESNGHVEIKKVQNLALYCLLNGNQHLTKPELETFKVEQTSPAMILLQKQKKSSVKYGNKEYWVWPHSRLCEFDAMVALSTMQLFQNSLWLYWLANRPDLNKAGQLLSVILGAAGKYEEVKTLTTATILLQSRAKCAGTNLGEKCEHLCQWTAFITELIQSKMKVKECFTKGEYQLQQTSLSVPSLESVSKCCGSLYNGSVSLFRHVQECWKLGLSGETGGEYVQTCNDALLPAIDR